MDRTPIVDLHTPWDCRWTRLAPHLGRKNRAGLRPDVLWVCVRDGCRRYVADEECDCCEHWEPSGNE